MKDNTKHTIRNLIVTTTALVALANVALYDGLTVKNYKISTPLVSEKHRFVLITDLHSTFYGKKQEKLISIVDKYSPEAVLFAGDIAHDKRDFAGTGVLLTALAKKYPCYYVTGNHEKLVNFTPDIKGLISECGAEVVSDKSIDIGDNIVIHGVDDPLFYSDTFESILAQRKRSDEKYDILLSHRPEYAEQYSKMGFDLALCGHAHGGQVRVPLILNGLYAPHQGLFPKYAGGQYVFNNGNQAIVSRGLMINDLPRVFNPPELVVIDIEAK